MNASPFAASLEPEHSSGKAGRGAPGRGPIAAVLSDLAPPAGVLSPKTLGRLTASVAGMRELWAAFVVEDEGSRWHVKLHQSVFVDVWLLGWQASQETDWHDHGGSSGSFAVASGHLIEEFRRPGNRTIAQREVTQGFHIDFGPTHVHNVQHSGDGRALSIHAYSPPLVAMTYYELGAFGLRAVETLAVESPEGARTRSLPRRPYSWEAAGDAESIRDLLDDVRLGLDRLTPEAAFAEMEAGAALVDIRTPEERLVEGEVPGAFVIGRNVLEWRLDPKSDASIPDLARYDRRIILMCSEGYASSLAAATLRRLGLSLATDLDGGFKAWYRAGLPSR